MKGIGIIKERNGRKRSRKEILSGHETCNSMCSFDLFDWDGTKTTEIAIFVARP